MARKYVPPLHVMVGFSSLNDADLIAQALAGHNGVKAHPELFPNPPDLDVIAAATQSFQTSIADALDGGKKAIAERTKARTTLIKALRPLGHYVEANSKDDPTIVAASGFKTVTKVHVPPQPTEPGAIVLLTTGSQSGQIVVKGKVLATAKAYILHYAALGADGKPGNWTEVGMTNPRAIPVNGLVPGTSYAFQLRGLGRLGYGDWSEIATRIAVQPLPQRTGRRRRKADAY